MSTSVKLVIACDLPSSRTWKSSFFRSRTRLPCSVGDDGVDLDVVDAHLEGRRLLSRRLRRLAAGAGRRGGLAGRQRGAAPAARAAPSVEDVHSWSLLSSRLYVPARRVGVDRASLDAISELWRGSPKRDVRTRAAILEQDVSFPGGGRARHRRGAGGAAGRRARRLAALRLSRPESDCRRRHRGRPTGRSPRDAPLVLPDSRDRRTARPGPRDREALAGAPARHRPTRTPGAISSRPACGRCSPASRRVAMEYSPRLRDSLRLARRRRHHRAGPPVGRRRRVVRRSDSALLRRLGRRRDRDAPAGVREAVSREGSRVRGGRAPAARRRRRPPNTTSSS